MTEILTTNFVHEQERRDETIPADAPYILLEPLAEGLNREEILDDVKEWAKQIGVEAPYTVPLGGIERHSLGEVLDDRGESLLEELNRIKSAPEAMWAVLSAIAKLAERSGFDREKAKFMGSFIFNDPETNPNLNIHSDGLSGLVKEDTASARTTRFVYALGPGTLIFPGLNRQGEPMTIDYNSPTNTVPVNSPSELQLINSARGAEFTDEELESSDAQQVVPGVILGFDPTRTFWHQAHDNPRPILVIDIAETT